MDAQEQAMIHRTEAKRLLGQFVVDQAVADRIVDCVIAAAMLETVLAMRSGMARTNNETKEKM